MNELPVGVRTTLEDWFPPGLTWEQLCTSGDLVTDWQDLGRQGAQHLLRHRSGAVVALRFAGGRLESCLVMEGRKADEQLSSFGFACPHAAQVELDAALRAGTVEAALDARYGPQRRGLEHLGTSFDPTGQQRRRYHLLAEGGGVLELAVGLDGRAVDSVYLTGPRARAAVEEAAKLPGWTGRRLARPLSVRSWAEARLWLLAHALTPVAVREQGRSGEVWWLVRDADGTCCWPLHIADRVSLRPDHLGDDLPARLDAALLVGVGWRTLDSAEPALRQTGAAALRAVLALIPAGEDRLPLTALRTEAGRELARREPRCFTRGWLAAAARQLTESASNA